MPLSQQKKRMYFQNLDKARKAEYNKQYYWLNSEEIRAKARSLYEADSCKRRAVAMAMYRIDPDKKIKQSTS